MPFITQIQLQLMLHRLHISNGMILSREATYGFQNGRQSILQFAEMMFDSAKGLLMMSIQSTHGGPTGIPSTTQNSKPQDNTADTLYLIQLALHYGRLR